jgi:ABC-2 type transport system permease protein
MQTMNDQLALGHASTEGITEALIHNNPAIPTGGRESVEGFQMITSFQYFAVSNSILFALFLSMTTALKAITERREHVLHRILLTGSHPIRYLAGKISSTFCITLLQMTFIFLVCHFALNVFPDRSLQFWLGIALITLIFCFCVAAMSAVFTSLSFRMKEAEAGGLMMFIIILIGTIGGSFVPVYILPNWLRQIGEYTPNGLTLSVFIQWIQQGDYSVVIVPLLQVVIFSLIVVLAGVFLFPKRGKI